jgi:hypothetical protein
VSAGARMLLLVAAAEPAGDPALLWRTADLLGVPRDAADSLQDSGLLQVGAKVEFRHPLVRSAVSQPRTGTGPPSSARRPPRGRDRRKDRGIMPTRAVGPAVAALAPACRARQFPPRAAAVPRVARKLVQTGSAQRTCRFERRRSRHAHPEAPCRCPAHPWQATGPSGMSAPPTYPPGECRLPAGLTECDGIGMGLRARSACPTVKV